MNSLVFAMLLLPTQVDVPAHFLVKVVCEKTNQPIESAVVEIRLKNSQDKAPMFVAQDDADRTNADGEAWFRVTGAIPTKLQFVARARDYENTTIVTKWNPDSIPCIVISMFPNGPRIPASGVSIRSYSNNRLSVVDTGTSIVYSASSRPFRHQPIPGVLALPYGPIWGSGAPIPDFYRPPNQRQFSPPFYDDGSAPQPISRPSR